jgi:hypothetical protein
MFVVDGKGYCFEFVFDGFVVDACFVRVGDRYSVVVVVEVVRLGEDADFLVFLFEG